MKRELFPAVEKHIRTATEHNITWRTLKRRGNLSSVDRLQLYYDKSRITLAAISITSYPLHATTSILSENAHTSAIANGKLVVAHLLVEFSKALREREKGNGWGRSAKYGNGCC